MVHFYSIEVVPDRLECRWDGSVKAVTDAVVVVLQRSLVIICDGWPVCFGRQDVEIVLATDCHVTQYKEVKFDAGSLVANRPPLPSCSEFNNYLVLFLMPLAAPENLFPLALTAFERFMLEDESPDFPMVFYLQVRLAGVVDRGVMRMAVDEALSRHPLLCCTVQKTWRGGHWVWAGDQVSEPDWDRDRWMSQEPWSQSIDLTSVIGLRVWGEQHADHAIITMQFHHACCDGIGAAQFLEDVAIAYARHYAISIGQEADFPEMRSVDLELLKTRNDFQGRRVANLPGSIFRRAFIILKYTLRYLRQKKLPFLSRGDVNQKDRQAGLGLVSVTLTRAETRGLRDVAKRSNASLNDLLVRELMLLSQRWNGNVAKPKRSLLNLKVPTMCVLVPTSLRGPADHELPACNVVSYVFMARPVGLANQPEKLLCTIRDEMQLVHQFQAGWLFIQAIQSLQRLPGMFRAIMRSTRDTCMSTTVLSHMGNMLNGISSRLPREGRSIKMGNLLVEDVCGIPPIRQGTAVAFSTMMVNGVLAVSMRCCADRFSAADVQALLNGFAEQLRQTASASSQTEERTLQDLATA